MTVLLDTNLLLRGVQPEHRDHEVANVAVRHLRNCGHELCLVPQVIYEFWVVATRPSEVNGLGLSIDRTSREVKQALSLFSIRRDERAIFERWAELVQQYQVSGKAAHDCRLVAAMQRHGISHLLTFNVGDFSRYSDVVTIHPGEAKLLTLPEGH
ncbi:type II toxin-antitoxin system VapC family toxin [Aeoliella sp. SH292]|uniref:type II toxin-antitoxin system VapC family toxin n=1 Tax=Aeoliella sp. SH292 TaxID=3454464 RepID=UPI003F9450EF